MECMKVAWLVGLRENEEMKQKIDVHGSDQDHWWFPTKAKSINQSSFLLLALSHKNRPIFDLKLISDTYVAPAYIKLENR